MRNKQGKKHPPSKELLESEYQLYLEKMELNEDDMTPIQRDETRFAFYGGFMQCLFFFINIDTKDISFTDLLKYISSVTEMGLDHFQKADR